MPEKIFVRRVKRLGKAFAAARKIKGIIEIYVYYVVCFRGVTAKFCKFRPRLFLVKHVKTPYCARPWQTAIRQTCTDDQTPPTGIRATTATSFQKRKTAHNDRRRFRQERTNVSDSSSQPHTRARCSRRQAAQTHIDYAANAHLRAKCGTVKTDKQCAHEHTRQNLRHTTRNAFTRTRTKQTHAQ